MRLIFFLIFPILFFAQNNLNYEEISQMPENEFTLTIEKNIKNLESGELWNLLYFVDKEFDLKPFNNILIEKLDSSFYAYDIYFLTVFLLRKESNRKRIENALNQKLHIWSSGEWSEKFWALIREHKLSIEFSDEFYSINEKGEKKYDLFNYLNFLINEKFIGLNPFLMIDHLITEYPENKLYETLSKLDIKDIKILPMDISVSVIGKRGSNGVITILTRE